MKSLIFPYFRTITTCAFVSLMVIGGNIDHFELMRSRLKLGSIAFAIPQENLIAQVVQGNSGGPVKSGNCGFIAQSPNYSLNLPQRVDYMRITVQAVGGQPTLLVVGPQDNDSFCVLGDRGSGLQPEISGVWEPGIYNIFIGDRTGTRHQFKLDISRSK